MRRKTNCSEYYLIDQPHSGYLMVDMNGRRCCLLVYSEQALHDHHAWLARIKAPADLVQVLRTGEFLPVFDAQDASLTSSSPCISNWRQHYHRADCIGSAKKYFVTTISEENLPKQYQGEIIPYSDFLESNSLNREIIH